MARELKDSRNVPPDAFLEDVLDILGEPEERVRIFSYDHCDTLEELRFEILADLMRDGCPRQEAEERAREIANALWETNEKLK